MFRFLLRTLWRILIFIFGIGLTWFVAVVYIQSGGMRLPVFLTLLIAYCLLAYCIVPVLFRLWSLVLKPNHLPLYAVTRDGWPADPVNIAVVAHSQKRFVNAMESAGWYQADKTTLKNSLREAYSILFNQPYPRAPFSTLYLFDRPFDIGFQKPANDKMSARSRHHVRFWEFDLSTIDQETPHAAFWHIRLKHLFKTKKKVWLGAAIDDTGPIGIRWRSGQLTHKNNPDTNTERDLIIRDLELASQIKTTTLLHAGEPFSFRGQTLGNTFVCDGTIQVAELKNAILAKVLPHHSVLK